MSLNMGRVEMDGALAAPLRDIEVQEEAPRSQKVRLHYLDWLRLLLVVCVVYAHTAKSGLTGGGGFNEAWLVDDQTLFDHGSYRDLRGVDSHSNQTTNGWPRPMTGPSPLAVRWISIVRQWCLPLLFWVSGASTACAYKGGRPRGIDKLLTFSAIGMALNAAIWYLGPLDDTCVVDSPPCANKGLVFNFTIVPWAGTAFAILFQMWYTIVLVLLLLLNWPLFAATYEGGAKPSWVLLAQWTVTMVLYATLVPGSRGGCPAPKLVLCSLGVLEAVFLAVAVLCAPGPGLRPNWMPLRAGHYLLALVTLLQFGALPYAEKMDSIGLTYLSFIVTGFNRCFGLGFLMTSARVGPKGDEVAPLISRVWPCMLLFFTLLAPSTNWDLAGMLTYPFFKGAEDRCLYVGGALAICFLVDRCSRGVVCDPLPRTLGHVGLLLYLFHPVLITLFLSLGLRSVPYVWMSSLVTATALVFLMCSLRRKVARKRSHARASKEEADETTSDSSSEGDGIL